MKYWLPYITIEHGNGMTGHVPDEAQDALLKEYDKYFMSIKSKLPADILLFADRRDATIYLNDGHLQSIDCNLEAGTVDIVVDGDVYAPGRGKLGWTMVTLHYEKVSKLQYIGENKTQFNVGVGDHLFDEIELIDESMFKHSMYFFGDIEIAITFGDFSLRLGELEVCG